MVVAAVVWLLFGGKAGAHEGPPYPILVDEKTPGYLISVWADPDVGAGTFYVIAESTDLATVGVVPRVSVWAEPVDGCLPRESYRATRQDVDNRIQLYAELYFDRRGIWTIGIVVHRPDGQTAELVTEVEVTPPGYGPWTVLIYLIPFLLFGGMWAIALVRRWRASRGNSDQTADSRLNRRRSNNH